MPPAVTVYAGLLDRLLMTHASLCNMPFPTQQRNKILERVIALKQEANLLLATTNFHGTAFEGAVSVCINTFGDVQHIRWAKDKLAGVYGAGKEISPRFRQAHELAAYHVARDFALRALGQVEVTIFRSFLMYLRPLLDELQARMNSLMFEEQQQLRRMLSLPDLGKTSDGSAGRREPAAPIKEWLDGVPPVQDASGRDCMSDGTPYTPLMQQIDQAWEKLRAASKTGASSFVSQSDPSRPRPQMTSTEEAFCIPYDGRTAEERQSNLDTTLVAAAQSGVEAAKIRYGNVTSVPLHASLLHLLQRYKPYPRTAAGLHAELKYMHLVMTLTAQIFASMDVHEIRQRLMWLKDSLPGASTSSASPGEQSKAKIRKFLIENIIEVVSSPEAFAKSQKEANKATSRKDYANSADFANAIYAAMCSAAEAKVQSERSSTVARLPSLSKTKRLEYLFLPTDEIAHQVAQEHGQSLSEYLPRAQELLKYQRDLLTHKSVFCEGYNFAQYMPFYKMSARTEAFRQSFSSDALRVRNGEIYAANKKIQEANREVPQTDKRDYDYREFNVLRFCMLLITRASIEKMRDSKTLTPGPGMTAWTHAVANDGNVNLGELMLLIVKLLKDYANIESGPIDVLREVVDFDLQLVDGEVRKADFVRKALDSLNPVVPRRLRVLTENQGISNADDIARNAYAPRIFENRERTKNKTPASQFLNAIFHPTPHPTETKYLRGLYEGKANASVQVAEQYRSFAANKENQIHLGSHLSAETLLEDLLLLAGDQDTAPRSHDEALRRLGVRLDRPEVLAKLLNCRDNVGNWEPGQYDVLARASRRNRHVRNPGLRPIQARDFPLDGLHSPFSESQHHPFFAQGVHKYKGPKEVFPALKDRIFPKIGKSGPIQYVERFYPSDVNELPGFVNHRFVPSRPLRR